MTPIGERASFEVYPFVDGSRRILSNYGFAEPAVDFPLYASWVVEGRLPVDRLIDRRIALDDIEDAFAAMRGTVRPAGDHVLTGAASGASRATLMRIPRPTGPCSLMRTGRIKTPATMSHALRHGPKTGLIAAHAHQPGEVESGAEDGHQPLEREPFGGGASSRSASS